MWLLEFLSLKHLQPGKHKDYSYVPADTFINTATSAPTAGNDSYLPLPLLFGVSTGGQNALIISSYITVNHPAQRDDALTAVP